LRIDDRTVAGGRILALRWRNGDKSSSVAAVVRFEDPSYEW
jgi:hypothetical protein